MRIGLLTALLLSALPAMAQQTQPGAALGYAPAGDTPLPAWEARFGLSAANPGGRESGLASLGFELLTPRLMQPADRLSAALVPRFNLGTSLNLNGTRYAYAGATWTIDVSRSVFVEASLGATLNDGVTGLALPQNRIDVACRSAARGAAGLGMRLSDRWSLVATLERYEAVGCGERAGSGSGPANFGARLGYTF